MCVEVGRADTYGEVIVTASGNTLSAQGFTATLPTGDNLAERPEDGALLLPVVRVALRSVRGPEWRAGISGIVQLVEHRPELEKLVGELFPELQLVAATA